MLLSLALVILLGLLCASICRALKLPHIIGMLCAGVLLGPFVLNLLDPSLLAISEDLRKLALVIILIKAGLSLNLGDLKKVGRPAALMCFVPATCEVIAFTVAAPLILGVTALEGALMGAVLAAVSPAVVVPKMVQLMEQGYGTKKAIPQMILAGASLDDVYVIVLFTTFLSMVQGQAASAMAFVDIPVSIVSGMAIGAVAGLVLAWGWAHKYSTTGHVVRNSIKVLMVLGVALALVSLEDALKETWAVSGLLGVMAMACAIGRKSPANVVKRLSEKFGKIWLCAELFLFVLVGAAVDIGYAWKAGPSALSILAIALGCRTIGVWICLLGTRLDLKERLFCIIAYLPKATVQAAIGGVPLALGLGCGQAVLSVAVVGILVTAPLGALGMELTYQTWLKKERISPS